VVKQEERRKETIRLLLDAVKSLILEKGCHAVTMRDIMARSGLSKGAIFHYVASKDELFVWVLQERLDETNERFMREVAKGEGTFEGPMRRIADSLPALADPADATNRVLMYLLGKEDSPAVAEALNRFYERSVKLSRTWIVTGQTHGVIPASVDADRAAELFVMLTFGLRMRASLSRETPAFGAAELAGFMAGVLNPAGTHPEYGKDEVQ